MKYRAICFDLDGTLYPQNVLHQKTSLIALRHPVIGNRYRLMRNAIRKYQGTNEVPAFNDMSLEEKELLAYCRFAVPGMAEEKAEKELRKGYYAFLEKIYSNLRPQPEVAQTLVKIRKAGLKTGVFSDWPLYHKLEELGLENLFDAVSSSSESGFLKPYPRAFDCLLQKLAVPPDSILYVGDSLNKDVAGAVACGMDAVLLYGKNVPDSCKAVGVFEDWTSFDRWIDGIIKEG